MPAITSIIAVASLTVGAAAYVSSQEARGEAKEAAGLAAEEGRKSQSEVKALNAQKAAGERRQQVREERVRRAKVEQGASNTGVSESSGEAGAISGLATQLGANIGTNLGQLQGANAISGFNQAAADFNTSAQNSMSDAAGAQNLFALSGSIFNAAGGVGAIKTIFNSPMPK